MLTFFVFAGLALVWVGFIWLVKREQGWVGVTDLRRAMLRLIGGIHLINVALAEALLPALRNTTKALVKLNDVLERTYD